MLNFLRHIRYFRRYRQIINVMIRYGFSEILDQLKLKRRPGLFRFQRQTHADHISNRPVRLRLAMEELGPTFVKIGQLLSTRVDLLPKEYVEEFSRLQDSVKPFPGEEARQQVEEELKINLGEKFLHFDETPLAAASISQVHQAVMYSGEEVVVKVKRPDIEPQILQDLQILKYAASFADRNTQWGEIYHFQEMAEEIEQIIINELDFRIEARNAERIKNNFKNHTTVYIPYIYEDCSTREVLTLEHFHGRNLNLFMEDEEIPATKKKAVADNIIDAYFMMIFVHGFFHGDPHPGNIIVFSDDTLALVDFGTAGFLDESFQEKLQLLLRYLTEQKAEEVTDIVIELGVVPDHVEKRNLVSDVARLQEKYYQMPLEKIELREVFSEFLWIMGKHKIRMPHEFLLLTKTIATVESIISRLDPDFKIVEGINRYKHVLQKSFFKRGERKTKELFSIYESFVWHFPQHLNRFTQKGASGDLKFNLEIMHMERMLKRLGNMINRLAFSIVLASLIVGLSLIIGREEFLFVRQLPIAEIALSVAGIAGLWWLFTILRSER